MTRPHLIRLYNRGANVAVIGIPTIAIAPVTQPNAFSLASNGCSGPVPPNMNCALGLVFAPPLTGTMTGVLSIPYNGGQLQVQLSGTAIPANPSAPKQVNFGGTKHGQVGRTLKINIANNNPIPLQLGSRPLTSDFGTANDGCANQLLAAHTKCSVMVTFSPQMSAGGLLTEALTYGFSYGGNASAVTTELMGRAQ